MLKKLYQFALLFLATVSCGGIDLEEFKDFQESEDVEIVEENEQTETKFGFFHQEVLAVETVELPRLVPIEVKLNPTTKAPTVQENPHLTFFFSGNPPNRA